MLIVCYRCTTRRRSGVRSRHRARTARTRRSASCTTTVTTTTITTISSSTARSSSTDTRSTRSSARALSDRWVDVRRYSMSPVYFWYDGFVQYEFVPTTVTECLEVSGIDILWAESRIIWVVCWSMVMRLLTLHFLF